MKGHVIRIASLLLILTMCFSTVAPAFAYSMVRYGSRGEDVRTLQHYLNCVLGTDLVEDGIAGAKTVEATKRFQRENGLTADGIAGNLTWQALQRAYDNAARSYSGAPYRLAEVSGVAQIQNMCTSCAMTVLLRRAQVVDQHAPTFTFGDVRANLGSQYRNGKWTSVNFYFARTWTSSDGCRYLTVTVGNPRSADELRDLLSRHPDGIYIYSSYHHASGVHAILVSDYTDGAFYAYDPAVNGGNRTLLTSTSVYGYSESGRFGGSMNSFLSNIRTTVVVSR